MRDAGELVVAAGFATRTGPRAENQDFGGLTMGASATERAVKLRRVVVGHVQVRPRRAAYRVGAAAHVVRRVQFQRLAGHCINQFNVVAHSSFRFSTKTP